MISPVAIKQTKVSDLTGEEEADFGVVVRDYPGLKSAKILDVTEDQATALTAMAVKDVVVCEVRRSGEPTIKVLLAKADFDQWTGGDTKQLLAKAAFLRGRRPGATPNAGSPPSADGR